MAKVKDWGELFISYVESEINNNPPSAPTNNNTSYIVKLFYSEVVPSISIRDYFKRILRIKMSPECFVLASYYIWMASLKDSNLILTGNTAHRLILITCMLAHKIQDDKPYDNCDFATVGMMTNKEVNILEAKLLIFLDFNIMITRDVFEKQCYWLKSKSSLNEFNTPTSGEKRNLESSQESSNKLRRIGEML